MAPRSEARWGPPGPGASAGFKVDAQRMWRAFVDLLNPSDTTAKATPLFPHPLQAQTEYGSGQQDSSPATDAARAAAVASPAKEISCLSSAQSHAISLVTFLRRLELQENRKRQAKQQLVRAITPSCLHPGPLRRNAFSVASVSTASSDAGPVRNNSDVWSLVSRSAPDCCKIKWTGAASMKVQVAGTFSDPPWSECIDMHFESESGAYIADLTNALDARKAKDVQLKFIVDGQWRLEATLPVCQDANGNWNNYWQVTTGCMPLEDRSPLTSSLFTAAARAAAAAAEKDLQQKERRGPEALWWPRYATGAELEDTREHPRDPPEVPRPCSTPRHLAPVSSMFPASPEDLRRIKSISLFLASFPPSVLSHLHAPEMLLGLVPTQHPRPEKARDGLSLQCGFFLMPHPDKVQTGGADAYFVAAKGAGGAVTVGVADGVGEWDSFDLDPRLFAEELMRGCCDAAVSDDIKGDTIDLKALEVLRKGYEVTRSFGSATALVVRHEGGDKLGIVNLGDSAIIVLRRQVWYKMTCLYRSKEQQHQFNCPFQLSRLPQPSQYEQLRASGKDALLRLLQNAAIVPQDTPESASLSSISIMEGDLLILGTDGVFDNLFDYELCGIANLTLSPFEARLLHNDSLATTATAVATAIGEAAAHRSRSLTANTPFMKQARQEGTFFTGGKMDDITVLVCWVISGDALQQRGADVSGFSNPASLIRGV